MVIPIYMSEGLSVLPDSKYTLHQKAYRCDPHPTAKSHKDWLPARLYKLYDIRVKSDGRHSHDNEELAQFFDGSSHGNRK